MQPASIMRVISCRVHQGLKRRGAHLLDHQLDDTLLDNGFGNFDPFPAGSGAAIAALSRLPDAKARVLSLSPFNRYS